MKTRMALLAVLLLNLFPAFGQGRVNFSNGPTTPIIDWGTGQEISGAGNFYFGLYLGPDNNNLSLAILATNTASAGRISGGNPALLPQPAYSAGTTYAFQIRGWSAAGGLSFEDAVQAATLDNRIIYGNSAFGFVIPTASPTAAAALFGTGPGQVGGFALGTPEPSTYALLGLGAAALLTVGRNRRRK